ncbi:MAG: EutN/CcmL family microcompartment protein [Ignavibacteriales bacterium]|nr:EutN/CcmL family microcompartment protein [Ignavibacteriales bacterium]
MFIGKIKGNIVSTHKNEYLKGHKLLSVQPIDLKGNFIGRKDYIAIDLVDAGVGDIVLIVQEGDAVQQVLGHNKAPVNTIVIAVVDDIDIGISKK